MAVSVLIICGNSRGAIAVSFKEERGREIVLYGYGPMAA